MNVAISRLFVVIFSVLGLSGCLRVEGFEVVPTDDGVEVEVAFDRGWYRLDAIEASGELARLPVESFPARRPLRGDFVLRGSDTFVATYPIGSGGCVGSVIAEATLSASGFPFSSTQPAGPKRVDVLPGGTRLLTLRPVNPPTEAAPFFLVGSPIPFEVTLACPRPEPTRIVVTFGPDPTLPGPGFVSGTPTPATLSLPPGATRDTFELTNVGLRPEVSYTVIGVAVETEVDGVSYTAGYDACLFSLPPDESDPSLRRCLAAVRIGS